MAIANRNLVFRIRQHLPDSQLLHKLLAQIKLAQYSRMILPRRVVAACEKDPSRIPDTVRVFAGKRAKQAADLTKDFDSFLEKAEVTYPPEVYQYHRTHMLFNGMAYGFAPKEYYAYQLDSKTPEEKRTYIADLDRLRLTFLVSDFKELQCTFDKYATYQKFKPFFKRDVICVASEKDFAAFQDFAARHSEMVIKAVSASGGDSIFLRDIRKDALKEQFHEILGHGRCCIEEKIRQSPVLGAFHPSSVNTVRVTTFRTKQGIQLVFCMLRTGRDGSSVDNAGTGGIFAHVNEATGVVDTDGADIYNRKFPVHPDTGIPFLDFALPEWQTCLDTALRMHDLAKGLGIVGWDLAYSTDGWVLVEANGSCSFNFCQVATGRGLKKQVEQLLARRA